MSARLDQVDLVVAGLTDVGLRRTANEDAALAERPVFLVADGMGGYEAGDRASAAVVAAFRAELVGRGAIDASWVGRALRRAEHDVAEIAATTSRGAGSTVTGVVLLEHEGEPHWLIVNVGDSRVYRLFGAELEQLTVDHSLAQALVDQGSLSGEERREFAHRNVITRAIGAPDARADTWLMPVTTGERLLVCSDGLHGELDDEQLRAMLTMAGRPESAAAALVDAAKRAGGRDNITVLVVDVRAGGAASTSDRTDSVELSASATIPI
ncbi:PP2C family serine/threonine-protein phosphatase [Schumannella sp. 10F1B-5-1]|uniref:PP2C family protein-serine/threonine phosphatase n=1 Tax=Schumannella sp. 10F1B-5-1 TaxID=2590780 RepID=UPI0011321147|nr:protein phosphatase 2C domain-containing protein [Schumannella sp. 10F1B-5-1]TPW76754.1 serine/threonine-protein phosphatase [Schumannella sp. 10F1B-5-1]